MKIRIGIGGSVASVDELVALSDAIGAFGFDSLWCSEVLTSEQLDPMIALTWAAATHPRLKLGTTMLLPGRNIVRLAKQLASIDSMSSGRLLVTFVPGINRPPEAEAIGLPRAKRRSAMEESVPVLRRMLAGEAVTHHGEFASLTDVTLAPLPVQQPLEFWLGGMAPRSLDLCGRLGDGWLPSLCTPEQAAAGREVIVSAATAAGRSIDAEHYGVSIGYSQGPLSERARARVMARAGSADIDKLVPVGSDALRRLLEEFVGVGFSKFVLRPLSTPTSWHDELSALADGVIDLQT